MRSFAQLTATRRTYVEAARENRFEDGIRKLLADLYPDNAHFIYELLQNAEDAGARHVTFTLEPGGLKVEHDGTRLFDLDDLTSITGISQSTKDEGTKIGKFGVGFKSVFAYTAQPVVLSGEFAFAIRDMFVPEPVDQVATDGWTTFWFPFDRADKPAERAQDEIARGLRDLTPETLLFLTSIESVMCTLPDGDEWVVQRTEAPDGTIVLSTSRLEDGESRWFRLTDVVDVAGVQVPIAVAFAMERTAARRATKKGKKKRKVEPVGDDPEDGWTVVPTEGRVFIYFPAVSEDSGLRFHVHAAFATTVARDAIRDAEGNAEIVDAIARLITTGLPEMRDLGLITDGLLSALPNDRDRLPGRYAPIRTAVLNAFGTQPLTPWWGADLETRVHEPASSLLRSTGAIRGSVSLEDANLLLRIGEPEGIDAARGWLRGSPRPRAREFLDSLEAIAFDGFAFCDLLSVISWSEEPTARFVEWIGRKDDAWVRRFYAMLGELEDFWSTDLPVIRVRAGQSVRHVPGPEAFLPTAPGSDADGLVLDTVAWFADPVAKDSDALKRFYKAVGTRTWDSAAQLDARIGRYRSRPPAVEPEHLADLRELVGLLGQGTVSARNYTSRRFLVAVERDGTRRWAQPEELFVDSPIMDTGLGALYESPSFSKQNCPNHYLYDPKVRLDPAYGQDPALVEGLLEHFDLVARLSVSHQHPTWNRQFDHAWTKDAERESHLGVANDWDLPWLDLICELMDEDLLRDVWRVACELPASRRSAVYQKNGSSRQRRMESTVVQRLRETAWILDRDGNLRTPAETSAEDLADGLQMPADTTVLDKIGFGTRAAQAAEEEEQVAHAARSIGFDDVGVARLAAQVFADPALRDEVLDLLARRDELPSAASADPQGRADRVGSGAVHAPARRSERRLRVVRIQEPGHLSGSRTYLRNLYTTTSGQMFCQLCHKPMPFDVGGEPYFEAVQFVRDSGRDLPANRLALCPTCGARYRHALETPLADLRAYLMRTQVGREPSVELPLVAAGARLRLRFVGKHAIDLQAELRATAGREIEDDLEFG